MNNKKNVKNFLWVLISIAAFTAILLADKYIPEYLKIEGGNLNEFEDPQTAIAALTRELNITLDVANFFWFTGLILNFLNIVLSIASLAINWNSEKKLGKWNATFVTLASTATFTILLSLILSITALSKFQAAVYEGGKVTIKFNLLVPKMIFTASPVLLMIIPLVYKPEKIAQPIFQQEMNVANAKIK